MATETTVVTFEVHNKAFVVTAKDFKKALKGKTPEPVRKYFIEVNGKRWPYRQALSLTTGLPRAAINGGHAYSIVSKLFMIFETR